MTMTTWPLMERPREKLLSNGAKTLSDAELLAIFLRTGTPGKTAVDLARELLSQYGSLKKLCQSNAQILCQNRGLGKAKYASLKAALELGRRYLEEEIRPGSLLDNSELTKRFLIHRLQDYPHEVFASLFLDNQNHVICFEELFHGTLNESNVYPREVVKRGLAHNAAKLVLAHNHPSGNLSPSQADQDLTQLLKQALALVDIAVVDHIIVGSKKSISFAELGLI